jgi:hypothetical protein
MIHTYGQEVVGQAKVVDPDLAGLDTPEEPFQIGFFRNLSETKNATEEVASYQTEFDLMCVIWVFLFCAV